MWKCDEVRGSLRTGTGNGGEEWGTGEPGTGPEVGKGATCGRPGAHLHTTGEVPGKEGREELDPLTEAEKAPQDMEEFVAENRLERVEVWGGVVGEL